LGLIFIFWYQKGPSRIELNKKPIKNTVPKNHMHMHARAHAHTHTHTQNYTVVA
jgi:multidrug resistance efflux pump